MKLSFRRIPTPAPSFIAGHVYQGISTDLVYLCGEFRGEIILIEVCGGLSKKAENPSLYIDVTSDITMRNVK